MTKFIIADMGVQPSTLSHLLVQSSASTDQAPPFSQLLDVEWTTSSREMFPDTISVFVCAWDADGGAVGAVEVNASIY